MSRLRRDLLQEENLLRAKRGWFASRPRRTNPVFRPRRTNPVSFVEY
jgi:hypothetical protein